VSCALLSFVPLNVRPPRALAAAVQATGQPMSAVDVRARPLNNCSTGWAGTGRQAAGGSTIQMCKSQRQAHDCPEWPG